MTTLVDGTQANAPFLAVQDGDGAWQVPAGAAGIYELDLESDRYGVAIGCSEGTRHAVRVYYATLEDATEQRIGCLTTPASLVDVTGSVNGIDAGHTAHVIAGRTGAPVTTNGASYRLQLVRGNWDVGAVEQHGTTKVPTSVQILRDQAAPTTAVVNFANGVTPTMHALTIEGAAAGETVVAASALITHGGTTVVTSRFTTSWYAIPPAAKVGNDVHYIATAAQDVAAGTARQTAMYVASGEPVTLAVPTHAPVPTIGVGSQTPYVRPTVTADAASTDVYFVQFDQTVSADTRLWFIEMSSRYVASSSRVEIAVPDLAGLQGFDARWPLVPGTMARWVWVVRSSTRGYLGASINRELGHGPKPMEPDYAGVTNSASSRTGELVL